MTEHEITLDVMRFHWGRRARYVSETNSILHLHNKYNDPINKEHSDSENIPWKYVSCVTSNSPQCLWQMQQQEQR